MKIAEILPEKDGIGHRADSQNQIHACAMANITDDTITIEVEIDDETEARLLRLSRVCGDSPGKIASSLLHDILADDQTFNEIDAVRPASLN